MAIPSNFRPIPQQFREGFIKMYSAALVTYMQVDVLQAAHRHVAQGHRKLMAQFIGDRVVLSGSSLIKPQSDLWFQYARGNSILKPLCIEQFLKAIAYTDGAPLLHTHDLVKLYDRLKPATQLEIDIGLRGAYQDAADACGIARAEEHKFRSGTAREILDRHNGDFQKIRYGEIPIKDLLARLDDLQLNITAVMYALLVICVDRAMSAGISDFDLTNAERL